MNRMYRQFRYGLENKVVDLYAQVAVGAVGAPTLNAKNSKGVASIARNSAGNYTITLQDKYVDLLSIRATFIFAAGSPLSGASAVVRSNAVSSAGQVTLELLDNTFTAADLASGVTMVIKIELLAAGR